MKIGYLDHAIGFSSKKYPFTRILVTGHDQSSALSPHPRVRWSIIKSNHPKAVGSSPFYIHEYVFSSKFLRNCDASKHIRFLKRTQAVNSTNKYTCVYRMYYGMVQICWTNSPFLFPWNTKIPMYFSSKMRWLSLFGVEGLDWTQILIWRLNFELVRVNYELILIQVFLHQNWTQTLFNPSKNLKLRIYFSRIRSNQAIYT